MKVGLNIKIILIIGIISFSTFSLFIYSSVRDYNEVKNIYLEDFRINLENSYIEKGKAIAYSLDASIHNFEEFSDEETLLSTIHSQLWLNPDIIQINLNVFENNQMITKISNNYEYINKTVDDQDNFIAFNQDNLTCNIFENNNSRILRIITPIHISGLTKGTYQIDLTLDYIDGAIAERGELITNLFNASLMGYIVISIFFELCVVITLYFFLRYFIIKPIVTVGDGVQHIRAGKYDHQISLQSSDEIGELAQSFNKMANDLKISREELQNYSNNLEKEVQKRTKSLEKRNIELTESKNRFQELANLIPVGVSETDDKLNITYANMKAFEITGYSEEDLEKGINVVNLISKSELHKVKENLSKRKKGQIIKSIEYKAVRKDGSEFYMLFFASPLFSNNKFTGLRCVFLDITEQKEINELLKDSQINYQTIFDSVNDAIFIHDTKTGKIVDVNQRMLDMYGIDDKKEVIGKLPGEFGDGKEPFTISKALDIHKKTIDGENKKFEWKTLKKNGEEFWVEVNPRRVNILGKERVLAVVRDITNRKKIESELIKSEEKYRELTEEIKDLIVIIDEKGVIQFTNKSLTDITGYTASDLEGKNAIQYIYPEDKEMVIEKSTEIIKKGEGEIISRFITKNNSIIWLEAHCKRITNNRLHIVAHDITDRLLAEEKIKKSLKEKEVLLSEIHHRVKNNMQVIGSLFSLQSRNEINKENLSLLYEAINRIDSMSLIHEMLYKSENLAEINLSDYITNLVKRLYENYKTSLKKIDIEYHLEKIWVNMNQANPCALIINELISNVFKYAFPEEFSGKGKLSITTEIIKDNLVRIEISDNGIGIPDEIDINNTTSLGLHLVKILTEDQLDGKVTLIRKNGTTFRLEFKIK